MEFSQIALFLVLAATGGVIAKFLKQPSIIGYIFAGVFLGNLGFVHDREAFEGLAQIGIALLLFLVGLEMNVKDLGSVSKAAFFTGLGQMFFTFIVGYFIAVSLGFQTITALYISIGLVFSSTILIVKLLAERNELSTLHGRILIGFLLVQDLVAILLIIGLAGLGRGDVGILSFFEVGAKTAVLFGILWILSNKVIQGIFTHFLDQSSELQFIASIAWALGLAAFVGGPQELNIQMSAQEHEKTTPGTTSVRADNKSWVLPKKDKIRMSGRVAQVPNPGQFSSYFQGSNVDLSLSDSRFHLTQDYVDRKVRRGF